MNPNIWLALLVIAVIGQLAISTSAQLRVAQLRHKVDAVCDLLMVWAQRWGNKDQSVTKVELYDVLRRYGLLKGPTE